MLLQTHSLSLCLFLHSSCELGVTAFAPLPVFLALSPWSLLESRYIQDGAKVSLSCETHPLAIAHRLLFSTPYCFLVTQMLPAACCWDSPSWLQAVEPGTLRMPTFAISQSCLELVVHTCRSHLSPDKFQGHLAFTEVLEAMSELPTSGCVLQRCLLLSCWAWGIFCGLGVSGKQKDFGSWALAG